MTNLDEAIPRLERCEFHPLGSRAEFASSLAQLVRDRDLAGTRCIGVLGATDYSLRALDAPDVAGDEMRGAVRWSLQELVDFDVEDAVVDLYELPQHECRRVRRVYAVAAKPEPLREMVQAITESRLRLTAIDVPELALRNLLQLDPLEADGIEVVAPRGSVALLGVYRAGSLFLARWIDTDLQSCAELGDKDLNDPDASGGSEELESLLLEIQRSADYYQHELKQRPVVRLLLTPLEEELPELCSVLSGNLRIEAEWLDLADLIEIAEPIDPMARARGLMAIGAALRRDDSSVAQQVNLLDRSILPKWTPLSPRVMAATLAGFAGISSVITIWLFLSGQTQIDQIAELEVRTETRQELVTGLETELQAHLDTRPLEARIHELESELVAKHRLVRMLARQSLGNSSGFSSRLYGFSRQRLQGVWFRGFEILEGGTVLAVHGSSLRPELIPRFLQRLGKEEAFRGIEFDTFVLSRAPDGAGWIDFEVSNVPEEGA